MKLVQLFDYYKTLHTSAAGVAVFRKLKLLMILETCVFFNYFTAQSPSLHSHNAYLSIVLDHSRQIDLNIYIQEA